MISAADWESDGSTGSYSIPVATTVTDIEGDFPCPTGQSSVAMCTHVFLKPVYVSCTV